MSAILPNASSYLPANAAMYQTQKKAEPEVKETDKTQASTTSTSTTSSTSGVSSTSSSKFGPSARVDITQQIIRMNIINKTPALKNAQPAAEPKYKRYDILTEIKKRLATEKEAADKIKNDKLQEIKDKVDGKVPTEEVGEENTEES
jgi:hypothetical protein